jgi:DNA-binding IclR family transcriptional regulator
VTANNKITIEDISQLETEIRLVRARNERVENENAQLKQLLDMIEAWDKEQSAVHRHAKLLEIMGFVRKAKRT